MIKDSETCFKTVSGKQLFTDDYILFLHMLFTASQLRLYQNDKNKKHLDYIWVLQSIYEYVSKTLILRLCNEYVNNFTHCM